MGCVKLGNAASTADDRNSLWPGIKLQHPPWRVVWTDLVWESVAVLLLRHTSSLEQ